MFRSAKSTGYREVQATDATVGKQKHYRGLTDIPTSRSPERRRSADANKKGKNMEPKQVEHSAATHCSLAFGEIVSAITGGKYVTWKGQWSEGNVLGAWADESGDEFLVLQSFRTEFKPFVSGYEQALVLKYVFTVRAV